MRLPQNDRVRNNDGGEPDRVDWLDLGPDPDEGVPPRDPRRRYLWYGLAAGVVVLALVLTRTQHATNRAASSPRSSSVTSPASSPSRTLSSSPASSGTFVDPPPISVTPLPNGLALGPPTVTNLGHPLLDVPADWELFGRGENVVVRIQLALGRITTTPVPVSGHEAPAVFFVGADRVLVHGGNDPTGYVVRDGKKPTEWPAVLRQAFSLLPGPDPKHLWVESGDGMTLRNLDGSPTGTTFDVPLGASVQGSDGAGYLLLAGIGGFYDARPGSVHRITSGVLLAGGPTRWLSYECDESLSCADVVIDRAGGARHTVRTLASPFNESAGTLSPDGRTAALPLATDGISGGGIQLLDLDLGTGRQVDVTPSAPGFPLSPQWAVWSPDSRWLFVADAAGRVMKVDRGSGQVTPLGGRLPPISQLAFRHRAS